MAARPGVPGALNPGPVQAALATLLALLALALPPAAQAGTASARYCDRAEPLTATQQDRLLRVADWLRAELQASGTAVALLARSGLDLSRFGLQHSHAGWSLRDTPAGPWAVRQLYYACSEQRPRLFDQGLAGFVSGVHDPDNASLVALLLPSGPPAQALATALQDNERMRPLLGGRYNAIAYPWATHSQNCNQWAVEALAAAWAPQEAAGTAVAPSPRQQAQRWLREAGYQPQQVQGLTHGLMFAAGFMPLLGLPEHPEDDRFALRLQVSVPDSVAAFVQQRLPAAQTLRLCFDTRQAVLRRGGPPLPAPCQPGPGDQVLPLR